MARFNLDDYETVESRIKKFYEAYPDGRIVTECIVAGQDGTWLFKAFIYLTAGDQAVGLPKATGYASEKEGGPQTDWKAELGETSAIGRALANMNLSGNKRASREEMQKVISHDWIERAMQLQTIEELRELYTQARANNAPAEILQKLKDFADRFGK